MADAQDKQGNDAQAASSKGGIAKWAGLAVGMFVIVTLSQAVAPVITGPIIAALNAPDDEGEDGKSAKKEKLANPIYVPLNPAMVVNFANDPSGFMQIEVQIMARDQHVIDSRSCLLDHVTHQIVYLRTLTSKLHPLLARNDDRLG